MKIETSEQYDQAMERIEELFNIDPDPGTLEGKELRELASAVVDYEDSHVEEFGDFSGGWMIKKHRRTRFEIRCSCGYTGKPEERRIPVQPKDGSPPSYNNCWSAWFCPKCGEHRT